MIRSIALAVTWRGDAASRFRSVILASAAVVVTLISCAAVSAALMVQRVNDRASERGFETAAADQPADLSRDAVFDSVRGEPIFVYFWRIESPGVAIPGIPAGAAEGDWYVSPELRDRIAEDPQLEGRFPNARPIGNEGVGSAEELVAYRLVGPEVELRERLQAIPGSEWLGLGAGIDTSMVALAGAGLVLIVGVGFIRAALGPVGVGLERRLSLLSALGATRSTLWRLTAASTAIVTLPAAVLTGAAWYVIAPDLQTVPLVGQRAFVGDLEIPAWLAAVVALGVVTLAAVLGARRTPRHLGSRPTTRVPQAPARWRVVPLLASLGLIAYSTALSDSAAVRGLLTGLLAAALSITFALPVIIDRLGTVLAGGQSTLALLVGRRLSWNAATSARPLMALAALAVVVPVAASYVAVARAGDPGQPPSSVSAIQVDGEFELATLELLERDGSGVFAEVYVTEPAGNESPRFTWVAPCDRLAAYVQLDRCGPEGIDVDPIAAAAFGGLDASSTVPPENGSPGFRLFITDDEDRAEAVLRAYVVNSDRRHLAITSRAETRNRRSPESFRGSSLDCRSPPSGPLLHSCCL